jgi:hypothetical protein
LNSLDRWSGSRHSTPTNLIKLKSFNSL